MRRLVLDCLGSGFRCWQESKQEVFDLLSQMFIGKIDPQEWSSQHDSQRHEMEHAYQDRNIVQLSLAAL